MNNLEIINIPIDDIICYGNNPRNNKLAVSKVQDSINNFGFCNPILIDNNNVIIAGHTRYKACKNLNFKQVPCVRLELNEEQARAYRIVDNKLNEISTWDVHKLFIEFDALDEIGFDLNLTGFSDNEIDNILNGAVDTANEEGGYSFENKEFNEENFNNDKMSLNFNLDIMDFRMVNSCLLSIDDDINKALVKLVKQYDKA